MALTLKAIGHAIKDALIASSALSAKCLDLYDKDATIVYISDKLNPQQVSSYPLIVVMPESRSDGQTRGRVTFTLQLGFAVEQTERTDLDEIVHYQGVDDLEDLMDIAKDIVEAISTELTVDGFDYVFDAVEYYPRAVGTLALEISYPKLIGGYEPTL